MNELSSYPQHAEGESFPEAAIWAACFKKTILKVAGKSEGYGGIGEGIEGLERRQLSFLWERERKWKSRSLGAETYYVDEILL